MKLLDESEELRKLRVQANRCTATLIPALFQEMFGNPAVNPNRWPIRHLADVVATGKIVTYGIVQAGPNIPNGIPLVYELDDNLKPIRNYYLGDAEAAAKAAAAVASQGKA